MIFIVTDSAMCHRFVVSYVLVRGVMTQPRFRRRSKAGWFKNLDPSYDIAEVRDAWVSSARIVYVGKAAGAKGLKQRIRQLVDFGFGKPIGHRGGRMLWHLPDYQKLQVRWRRCSRSQADRLETCLIGQFRDLYGKRPFANRTK